jgi:hypothetical protein
MIASLVRWTSAFRIADFKGRLPVRTPHAPLCRRGDQGHDLA